VESRLTLDISVTDDGRDRKHTVLHRSALNDLVLQRPAGDHTVRLEVAVNGASFLTFAADSPAGEFGSARDDDAQHPEPDMGHLPPHPRMQPWPP